MASVTVTITDTTKGPFCVATLFKGGTIAGITLVPAAPATPPRIANELTVQADPSNGSAQVYWGDKNLTPASAETGIVLPAYGAASKKNIPLVGEFVNASGNGAALTIAADGGQILVSSGEISGGLVRTTNGGSLAAAGAGELDGTASPVTIASGSTIDTPAASTWPATTSPRT